MNEEDSETVSFVILGGGDIDIRIIICLAKVLKSGHYFYFQLRYRPLSGTG